MNCLFVVTSGYVRVFDVECVGVPCEFSLFVRWEVGCCYVCLHFWCFVVVLG